MFVISQGEKVNLSHVAVSTRATRWTSRLLATMKRLALALPLIAVIGVFVEADKALAANECGILNGSAATAVCDGTPGNTNAAQGAVNITPNSDAGDASPFASGIWYSNVNGLALNVKSGILIAQASGVNADGVQVESTTALPLSINLSTGVTINVAGQTSDGVHLQHGGTGNIGIISGANITADNAGNVGFATSSSGLYALISNTSSAASISIEQLAGSSVNTVGDWSNGVYGQHNGLGAVTLKSSGSITTAGLNAYAMDAWNHNVAGAGDVSAELTAS